MATTTEQLIRDLREQIEDLSKRAQPIRRSTFAERFRADLAGATEASPGYQAVHAMIQREVGGDLLARHVSQHGFDLRAYVAVMKAYYSREGRQARAA